MKTDILPVDLAKLSLNSCILSHRSWIDAWRLKEDDTSVDAQNLRRAARELRENDVPVAFPTETVYGLGADATRSPAVQGIYKAKQRPTDNPLIVHIWSLDQMRELLRPGHVFRNDTFVDDPIPTIYKPLISKFWPGPLTLIVPNPPDSKLAPEVTAGLTTFGVRMPRSPHALALLKLANVPLAAPSANASTKPSPTEATHVKYDLEGRISTIIDGGPCSVGVESTVVDGLSSPPSILRPGGISIAELRSCPGWEDVTIGYKDNAEANSTPRAPGMKYKHYSPKASVVLYEHTRAPPTAANIGAQLADNKSIGVIRTLCWPHALGLAVQQNMPDVDGNAQTKLDVTTAAHAIATQFPKIRQIPVKVEEQDIKLCEINLGGQTESIAQGLFAALRDLDKLDVDAIFVEGIDDASGDVSAAVMNRLRKAAELKVCN
jgi:L-threonylcarbamoyladenylate synthase